MKLTKEKFGCAHCGKKRLLVKGLPRGRAYLCEECYKEMLAERRAKRQALKELNKMAMEILR